MTGSADYSRTSSTCVTSSTAKPLRATDTMYIAEERGSAYAPDYRVFFSK